MKNKKSTCIPGDFFFKLKATYQCHCTMTSSWRKVTENVKKKAHLRKTGRKSVLSVQSTAWL